jgi:hypothetical protein
VTGALVHRNIDILPLAAIEPVVERDSDTEGSIGRSHAVGNFTRRLQRRLTGFSRKVEQIAQGDSGDVIGLVIAPGSRLTEGCDRGIDDPGVLRAQC